MNQDKRIAIRLNEHEFLKLQNSGETYGLSAGRYLKKVALETRLRKPKFDHESTQKIILELSRQGNNLNQITNKINAGQQASNTDFQRILKGYAEIWRLLQE